MSRTVTLERSFEAPLDDVWELWTTPDGIEAWWGPDGFEVRVEALDFRVGGTLVYVMSAVGADQIAFMQRANQPSSTRLRARYTLIEPKRLVAWQNLVEFVPGVAPYEVETRVELREENPGRVYLRLVLEAMHDDYYTGLATAGWKNELDKLGRALSRRKGTP